MMILRAKGQHLLNRSNFFAAACLIILCHEIKTDGWEELTLWRTPIDYDGLFLVSLSALLFLYTLISRRRKRRQMNLQ